MKVEDKRGLTTKQRKYKKFPKQITAEAKRHLIISDIAQGMTYMDIVHKYESEWGLSLHTVMNIVNDAIDFMKSDTAKESLKAMNLQRLDTIISDSMDEKDRKNAIKAIDVQNKLAGGYEEKIKIDKDSEINLVFDM